MNPRTSLRYILGLYEHELNGWLEKAIPRVNALFDVGANHGFFCFGVMAAWKRLGLSGKVWAFEPQGHEIQLLKTAAEWHRFRGSSLVVEHCFVGAQSDTKTQALDEYLQGAGVSPENFSALVKIDVEGAEMDVLLGAQSLVRPGNLFLIEVHSAELLDQVLVFFRQREHAVEVIEQQPLPILGRELRDVDNWWVVSQL